MSVFGIICTLNKQRRKLYLTRSPSFATILEKQTVCTSGRTPRDRNGRRSVKTHTRKIPQRFTVAKNEGSFCKFRIKATEGRLFLDNVFTEKNKMSYTETVKLIFAVITALVSLPAIHFIVFAVIGLFAYKKYPKAKKERKLGIVISARNEEKVIANLIESVKKNKYPQNLLTVFVVAHNCDDNTAANARSAGAVVYEYTNDKERMKGYALKHLFRCIERDYGILSFDGFVFFDADNVLAENYIAKMNDAYEYYDEKSIIIGYRNSKNFSQNLISGMYGVMFACYNVLECRGRTICNCSGRVSGTGFMVNSQVMKDGWNYVTITEDLEFTADQILRGIKIRYCEEAVFYDEQPTTLKVMLCQRLRWAKGSLMVLGTRAGKLFKGIFAAKSKTKGSTYDIWAYILPYAVIGLFLGILQAFLLSPLFGVPLWNGLTFKEFVEASWVGWVISAVSAYMLPFVQSVAVFVAARDKIPPMSFGKKLLITLIYPFFTLIALPLAVIAMFKKAEWKPIPHDQAVTYEALSGSVAATVAEPDEQSGEKDKTE